MAAVSVCIPAYNYGRFLREAVESVFAQSWRDFELIVVDNCSSDETAEVARALAREHPALRYERNSQVLDMAANFNRALRLATGGYVKILCADDWLAPDALSASVDALARHPRAAMAVTGRLLVPEHEGGAILARYGDAAGEVQGIDAINRCLYGTNAIGEPSAVLFRRDLAARGFDERYRHLVDLEMWFHLLEQGALACIPEPLTMIRQHAAQATRDNAQAGIIVRDKQRLYADYRVRAYATRTPWSDFRWRLRTAYNAWRGTGGTGETMAPQPSAFVHPLAFFALLPLMLAAERARDALGRWRARRHLQRANRRRDA